MNLTTFAVTRPVAATVIALIILVLGVATLGRLPVREYPNVDDPVVSVTVQYPGASAEVVEREVTERVEEAVTAIEGVRQLRSNSRDGRSRVAVEFTLDRDVDLAAADVRDRVATIASELPDEAESPVIAQRSLEAQVVMWLTLTSDELNPLALSDFADRVLVDRLSTVSGVATVLFGGERRYAMRIWVDVEAMAARDITVLEVEQALRARNVELPAGRLESQTREITVRTLTELDRPEEYRDLIVRERDGVQITLDDIARVEYGPQSERSSVRFDGEEAVGLGIVRQTGSNTVAVAQGVRAALAELEAQIPKDIDITVAYDESTFIAASTRQIVQTLLITVGLVVAVIALSLGSWRSPLVPAVTIPSSVLGAFIVLYVFGFSINVLTLLALILAIGMLVDDAIVVAENVFRYFERGHPRLLSADQGGGEVAFAVVSTTLVLLAVIAPLAFLGGDTGRLFTEFAAALGGALGLSSLLALTLGLVIAARVVDAERVGNTRLYRTVSGGFDRASNAYLGVLRRVLDARWLVLGVAVLLALSGGWLFQQLPQELSPREDRGVVFIPIEAPEGASMGYMENVLDEVESLLLPLTEEDGPAQHVISLVAPRSEGQGPVNSGIVILRLKDWSQRDVSQFEVTDQLLPKLQQVTGAQAFAIDPPSLGGASFEQPVQLVIAATELEQAAEWAREVLDEAGDIPGLAQTRIDYQPESPQTRIRVDRPRAASLGIDIVDIGRTLQLLFGGEDVTDFALDAENYEVMLRAEAVDRMTPQDLRQIYMRAGNGELVALSGLVDTELVGRTAQRNRVDRLPAVTVKGTLAPGASLGDVLQRLEDRARQILPREARLGYLGVSEDFSRASSAFLVAFAMALVLVYLVLAAQFESFVQPVVLLAGVPLAVLGSLGALALAGETLNIFSQIGLVLAIGIMAKNAVLLVEFVNQLRDRGYELREAVEQAAAIRFRPIVMTSIATFIGAVPLALATGPGAETRSTLGVVILGGVLSATLLTLLLVPVLYVLIAGRTRARNALATQLEHERENAAAGAAVPSHS